MILHEFLDQLVEQREEMHTPVVKVQIWERIAFLLWKNGGTFVLPICNHGLAPHPSMSGIETMELFEYKALLYGAGMYTQVYELEYLPRIQARMKELDEKKKLTAKQVKWN